MPPRPGQDTSTSHVWGTHPKLRQDLRILRLHLSTCCSCSILLWRQFVTWFPLLGLPAMLRTFSRLTRRSETKVFGMMTIFQAGFGRCPRCCVSSECHVCEPWLDSFCPAEHLIADGCRCLLYLLVVRLQQLQGGQRVQSKFLRVWKWVFYYVLFALWAIFLVRFMCFFTDYVFALHPMLVSQSIVSYIKVGFGITPPLFILCLLILLHNPQ